MDTVPYRTPEPPSDCPTGATFMNAAQSDKNQHISLAAGREQTKRKERPHRSIKDVYSLVDQSELRYEIGLIDRRNFVD
jgi:hypothetical protein